jgi:hypothetical protein
MPKASIWAKYNANRNPKSTYFPQINHIRRTAQVLSSQHAAALEPAPTHHAAARQPS